MKLKQRAALSAAIALISALSTQFTAGLATAEDLHNVTYRARIDGISRGALITYKVNDTQVNSSDPTMLPGRTFEANAVLEDPAQAGMRISIQWPYSANLHCEILVDDNLVAQADQFIGPRLTPAKDDPDYGALTCGAPLIDAVGTGSADSPTDTGSTNANATTPTQVPTSIPAPAPQPVPIPVAASASAS